MHELSIAYNLVEMAEAAAREAGAERVEVLHLRLGLFAGVVKDALFFGYDLATEGTLLQGSKLEIEDVPLVIYCKDCDRESELPSVQLFQCPICGSPSADIRHGRELELTSMEIS
jgi:hydrogenase nickel incorporation protein HypA/HybF